MEGMGRKRPFYLHMVWVIVRKGIGGCGIYGGAENGRFAHDLMLASGVWLGDNAGHND